ncbi:MAG: hypothetical protein ONB07_11715 [candidate division KSB1 bacterium]|nr:hypothetical protein [candidate division KSB1 bacterium]
MILVNAHAGPEQTPGSRRLILVDTDVVEAHDDDFVCSHWLFEGLLALVENRTRRYVTGLVVPKEQAHALADALAALPLATFQVALAIHGDPTGEGVMALCRFLRQGNVPLVDGDSISA